MHWQRPLVLSIARQARQDSGAIELELNFTLAFLQLWLPKPSLQT